MSAPVDVDVAALAVEVEVAGSSPKISVLLLVLACLYFSYLCQDLDPSFLGLVQRTVIFWFGATGGNLSRIFPFALLPIE